MLREVSTNLRDETILVTGGRGFLGTHVINELKKRGAEQIFSPSSKEIDLRERQGCKTAVRGRTLLIHLAAKVGGIGFNQEHPGELFYNNLIIGAHLMEEARLSGVKKFVAIGTVCSYPKFTPTPFKEDDLWNGYPEETNAPYGLAKKMLLVQAQAYRDQYGFNAVYLIPVNLYGPGDNFDPKSSHVIPALIKKISEAKSEGAPYLSVWGTGSATREFLYVEDAAEAIVSAAIGYNGRDPVNLGTGQEISIRRLTAMIAEIIGYKGEIRWDSKKPDGQPKRRLNVDRAAAAFGFKATTPLERGLQKTIDWYLKNSSVKKEPVAVSA